MYIRYMVHLYNNVLYAFQLRYLLPFVFVLCIVCFLLYVQVYLLSKLWQISLN